MRKTVIYNTGETIRFRCWNRKGYAIFRSLHRHVTIGRVCKSIADSALKKDKNTLKTDAEVLIFGCKRKKRHGHRKAVRNYRPSFFSFRHSGLLRL